MRRFLSTRLLRTLLVMFALICFSAASYAQKTVSGKVVDDQGQTLPGVNVMEKGTTNGTITDIDGVYHLNVGNNATLEFSFIGFETVEINAANGTTFDVTMMEDTKQIDEVVVVGYGTMKKSDVSGSSITVGASDIEGFVGSGIDQALQGKAAGVQITANSGQPGGGMNVSIRGNGTLSLKNSQPLYVVDGVPIQNVSQSGGDVGLGDALGNGNGTFSGLSNLNPDDIESMEILKDASATAIYGSRAANGVVLITTKKGKKGKANFNYTGSYGISKQATKLDVMNLREFATYQNQLAAEGIITNPDESLLDPSLLGDGTDWQDAVFRTAIMQSHQLSASGGNENARYYISAGYYDQEGTMEGSSYTRFSTRVNLDANLTNWLKVGTNTSFARSEDHLGLTNSEDGILSMAYQRTPDIPIYYIDGTWANGTKEGQGGRNPLEQALSDNNKLMRYDLVANMFAEINFMKGLTLRSEYNTDYLWSNAYHFEPYISYGSFAKAQNEIRHQSNKNFYWEVKNYLTYTNTFFDVHNITAMFGQETSEFNWEYISGSSVNLESNDIQEPKLGENQTIGSGHGSGARVSIFGRFNYSFNGKYNMTYTYRRDASSNFGPSNRWGNFHSVSASWNAHKESFLQSAFDAAKISTARLRIGWGQVGNDNIGSYLWGASGASDVNGLGSTYQITNIPNEAVGWETQTSWNFGLDFGFLKDRFNLIVEFYNKVSKDMLMTMQLPSYMGTSGNGSAVLKAPSGNFGEINNKGVEFTVSTTNINKRGFKWTTDLQLSFNRNELVSLSGSGNSAIFGVGQWTDQIAISKEGSALYQFYGYKVAGVYQDYNDLLNSPRDGNKDADGNISYTKSINRYNGVWIGDLKYEDINGDGVINESDLTVIGNPNPKFAGGLTNNFSYKGFELGLFLTFSYGNDIFNYNGRRLNSMSNVWINQTKDVLDHAQLVCIDESKTYPTTISGYNDANGNPIQINSWQEDPSNVKVSNSGTDVPRAVVGDPANNQRLSDRYVEDGSYLKIKTLSLAYNLPKSLISKWNISAVKVSASVSNLYTFTKYSGMDPEVGTSSTSDYVIGVDNGRYPTPRIVTFGVNVSF